MYHSIGSADIHLGPTAHPWIDLVLNITKPSVAGSICNVPRTCIRSPPTPAFWPSPSFGQGQSQRCMLPDACHTIPPHQHPQACQAAIVLRHHEEERFAARGDTVKAISGSRPAAAPAPGPCTSPCLALHVLLIPFISTAVLPLPPPPTPAASSWPAGAPALHEVLTSTTPPRCAAP